MFLRLEEVCKILKFENNFDKILQSLRKLEKLSLHDNLISNIDVLAEIQFKRVQRLYFENNKVDYTLEHNQKIIEELKKIERDIKY